MIAEGGEAIDRIVVDVGNSAATVARAAGGKIFESTSLIHCEPDFEARLEAFTARIPAAAPAGVASVNPAAAARVVAVLSRSRRVLVAPRDFAPTVENACVPQESVGQDRLFDAEAADRTKRVVIVDAGTAITVDLADRGVFRGGAIAPGVRMAFAALHHGTGQLPLIAPDLASGPPPALGNSTPAALRAGVIVGLAGLVDRLVSDLRGNYDAEVLITGGDAPLLVPLLRCRPIHDETLTLRGIAMALERALR